MLVLERKLNEIISIQTPSGDIIDIQLMETHASKARIGIDAPQDYVIFREELEEDFVS